jgi:hypothetical protein
MFGPSGALLTNWPRRAPSKLRAGDFAGISLLRARWKECARELNRAFLSALRKVVKRTTLRAEWTSGDNTTERFFDYVLKKAIRELK